MQDFNQNINPEELMCINEKQKIMIDCITQLKEDYKDTIYLYYYEQLSINEISKIMKKSKKQIYNLLQRAKKALEPLLIKEGVDYENK